MATCIKLALIRPRASRPSADDQAVSMLGSLKTFIAGLTGDARPRNPRDDGCRLATAALLVHVASADRELSQLALRNLHCVLKSRFRLDDVATAALLDAAAAAERRATDLYHFTRRLNEVLDHDGRRLVVGMMWQIAYADGRASEFASHIIWRAADLLGVSARERIELRNRSAAERGMLANQRVMEPIPNGAIESHAS